MEDLKISYWDLLDNITEGAYITDIKRKIIYWNKAAERITGYTKEEVLGKHCYDNILIHIDSQGCNLCKGSCPLAQSLTDGESRHSQIFLHHKEGYRKPVYARILPIRDGTGKIIAGVEFFNDIMDHNTFNLKMLELEQLAFKDQLTELPNRRYAEEQLISRLSEFERLGIFFGLLFFDIDHFKKFNDTFGHETGDKILKTVAKTLNANSRQYDLYSRWGGEEFIGIIAGADKDSLLSIANKILILVRHSEVTIDGAMHSVTISVGGTLCQYGDTYHTIVKRADALMYNSKEKGRNCVTI
ncbi:MAG TPA: sensor domain-containing diguanylate cyclase [Lentisphaeria bacterium]|nr:MAG: diguanylate cyclase [Lentisphaerae bacterium GWF2_38_69]HBM14867.1 sensor domain-containing diguanylate cyclase [Lentisphaeria bacterium]